MGPHHYLRLCLSFLYNKFKGTHWDAWKAAILNLLKQAGLIQLLDDDVVPPLGGTLTFTHWEICDSVAFGHIYNNMSEERQVEYLLMASSRVIFGSDF